MLPVGCERVASGHNRNITRTLPLGNVWCLGHCCCGSWAAIYEVYLKSVSLFAIEEFPKRNFRVVLWVQIIEIIGDSRDNGGGQTSVFPSASREGQIKQGKQLVAGGRSPLACRFHHQSLQFGSVRLQRLQNQIQIVPQALLVYHPFLLIRHHSAAQSQLRELVTHQDVRLGLKERHTRCFCRSGELLIISSQRRSLAQRQF